MLSKDHPHIEGSPGAVCKPDQSGCHQIHSQIRKLRACLHKFRLGIHQGQNHSGAIAPKIIHGSAAEFLMKPEILLVALRDKGRLQIIHLSDPSTQDILLQALHIGALQVRISLRQDHAALLRRPVHFRGFLCIQGQGLFTEHMLPRAQRLSHPFQMQMIGKRHIYCLHRLILQQLRVASISLLDPKLLCKGLSLLRASPGYGV